MGVESVLGRKAIDVAIEVVSDDKARRAHARKRVQMYRDNGYSILREEVHQVFTKPEVRAKLEPFLRMACAQSVVKRIVDEKASTVYSTPPTRKVEGSDSDRDAFRRLAESVRLDSRFDLSMRLTEAVNTVWLLHSVSDRIGPVLHLITPDCASVIQDPDDPTRALGYIYDRPWRDPVTGRKTMANVFWDDEQVFVFSERGGFLPFPSGPYRGQAVVRGTGPAPIVELHKQERWQSYWDDATVGDDLYNANVAITLLTALALKLHKSQGFRQLYIQGDVMGTPQGQTLDEENAIVMPDGTSIGTIDLKSDASHYAATIDMLISKVAANHGIGLDRLNQRGGELAGSIGLLERRSELIKIGWLGEQQSFKTWQQLGPALPADLRISQDAKLEVDYGEIHHKIDRLTQLKIREEEERMGLRSRLDDIMEDQPEVQDEKGAIDEYLRNLLIRTWRVEKERALNMPHDVDGAGPGQDAAANGAMGPAVRDGDMSRDEARDQARRPKPDSTMPGIEIE